MTGDEKGSWQAREGSLFWADQIARDIAEREKALGRGLRVYRSEMGMGASGIPHVGSVGDGVRAFSVHLALQDLGVRSEFVAFSDDRDGLRKIPAGFPKGLESCLGKPVSAIEDPFGCHESFGMHVSSLLMDAFEKLGVAFTLKRSSREYPGGTFDREIVEILARAQEAGRIIKEVTGSEKFLGQLPYLPVCGGCGRIYTTRAYKFIPGKNRILYRCDLEFMGKDSSTGREIHVKGCGHNGECGIREGKLAWKVEFAARWRALKISHEAYGKDILDSVRCNDAISERLLGWAPPLHSFYEMFTERGGRKISKSAGNVFTPQAWLRYGSPESLRLLFLKRLGTTRAVDMDVIPSYMDEVDSLAGIYFGKIRMPNEKELSHSRRLYEYINFLKPPKKEPKIIVPYRTLSGLFSLARDRKIVGSMLSRTGHIPEKISKEESRELEKRLEYAENWAADTIQEKPKKPGLSQRQRHALRRLAGELSRKWTEDGLANRLFEIAKEEGLPAGEFFRAAYMVLLSSERGPRLAPFILALGRERVAKLLKKAC